MSPRRATLLLLVVAGALACVAAWKANQLRWAQAEADAAKGTQAAYELMRVLDADNNGHLDAEEWASLSRSPMASWDQDGDGRIDAEELRDGAWQHSPLLPEHRGQPDH